MNYKQYFIALLFSILLSSCKTTVTVNNKPELSYSEPEITNLFWKVDSTPVSEACEKDTVRLTFDTLHIPPNEKLTISIYEKNTDTEDDFVAELVCQAEENNAVDWIVEFDKEKCKTSAMEIDKKGYTLPQYYFLVQYGGYTSEKSDTINIYTYLKQTVRSRATGEVLPHLKYIIRAPDNTIYPGVTDENGQIEIKKITIGAQYIVRWHYDDEEDDEYDDEEEEDENDDKYGDDYADDYDDDDYGYDNGYDDYGDGYGEDNYDDDYNYGDYSEYDNGYYGYE